MITTTYTYMIVSSFFFFFSSRRRHTRYWRDWSSDVCSSDLSPVGSQQHPTGETPVLRADANRSRRSRDGASGLLKIGRASCRERMKISVVAVTLKKKKKQ